MALDSDPFSLQEVQRCFGRCGVKAVAASVRQLLGRRLGLGEFDFIYSTGLYDYLQQPVAKRLTERMFDMLRPGGELFVANFLTGITGRGIMESFMDWFLTYRSHPDMLDLVVGLPPPAVDNIHLYVGNPPEVRDTADDEMEAVIVYLSVKKRLRSQPLRHGPGEPARGSVTRCGDMSQDKPVEVPPEAPDPIEVPATSLADMQQDILAELFEDELLNEAYGNCSIARGSCPIPVRNRPRPCWPGSAR